eukprot:CAMPEP_0204608288 /NCGR_PEP_ID=MMETSP0661-20131031/60225_1 /ASSEMBLY_ACC=CAM_ASM_000606 /TAXON_ID=109239 /ORGANISM="Alexandrium margalefi, Strain AMGDE01CS-322" /LENGTH=117 /DNA_ID=CAMNT_0051619787 /DNA_START=361 /DNA_END=714 /DNA_ORIENTATION=-
MIISDTSPDDPELLTFDEFRTIGKFSDVGKVDFSLGDDCSKHGSDYLDCFRKMVSDLDCMTTSDVLLLSHGSFSASAWALQQYGKTLVMKTDRHGFHDANTVDTSRLPGKQAPVPDE